MRQIVLDTETTGLDPLTGDRVIEVAAVMIAQERLSKMALKECEACGHYLALHTKEHGCLHDGPPPCKCKRAK